MKTNAAVIGFEGAGKTRSVLTLLPEFEDPHTGKVETGAGLRVAYIGLEPGFEAVFGRNGCAQGLHVAAINQAPPDWEVVRKFVSLANAMSMDDLVKMKDPGRSKYVQFSNLFETCKNFVCRDCGEVIGDISELDEGWAAVTDSMTAISKIAMQAVAGGKPIKSLPEYGNAMDFVEAFYNLFWGATKCSAITLAHVDRETNPVTGMSNLTLHTIGQKLAPRLVKIPDEIILQQHDPVRHTYSWSTIADGITLKRRRLPESASLPPTFAQIFK